MSQPLVVLGSARSDGDTRRAIGIAFGANPISLVDLAKHRIAAYDYAHANLDDDFLGIAEKMIAAETIVFATPVYWYAMSGPMKTFFDRFTDLLTVKKSLGRSLAGKDVWLLACGTDKTLPDGFEVPFRRTAAYFDMRYRGSAYLYTGDEQDLRFRSEIDVAAFGTKIVAGVSR